MEDKLGMINPWQVGIPTFVVEYKKLEMMSRTLQLKGTTVNLHDARPSVVEQTIIIVAAGFPVL